MKYSIKETGETISPYKLYRYDEYAGVPNNAELEFWVRIQELESSLEIFKTTEKFVLEQYECAQKVNIEAEIKIKELEKLCAEKEERINKLVFEVATWGELLKKNK